MLLLPVTDASHTAETRRNARNLALAFGFNETGAERVAIVVTEVCTNLLKHAGGGQVLIRPINYKQNVLLEILGLDGGPGMADLENCERDGFSTTGTMGGGLGAIERLASYYDVYSRPGAGTALLARVSNDERLQVAELQADGLDVPKPGQDVCGDSWSVSQHNGHLVAIVADGLGHGPDAATASRTAIEIGKKYPELGPREMLLAIHGGLRHTRGAAVAVALLDREQEKVVFAGIGNISARISAPGDISRQMVSLNGTAGIESRSVVREFQYPLVKGAVLIMHSDGLKNRWELSDYPGLISRDPAMICAVLFRDFQRGTDDASIVVAK